MVCAEVEMVNGFLKYKRGKYVRTSEVEWTLQVENKEEGYRNEDG